MTIFDKLILVGVAVFAVLQIVRPGRVSACDTPTLRAITVALPNTRPMPAIIVRNRIYGTTSQTVKEQFHDNRDHEHSLIESLSSSNPRILKEYRSNLPFWVCYRLTGQNPKTGRAVRIGDHLA